MFALSKLEVRRILNTIDLTSPFGRRDYLLVLFMYHTGLRVGETPGLVIGLVDHDRYPRRYLHLPAAICKNSRGRVVPLNEVAQTCVVKLLTFYYQIGFSIAPDAPLFQNRLGGHLSVRSIQKLDVRATPHTLRHSHASQLVAAGVPTVHVQKILGHRQLSSTQVYCMVTKEELARSASALE